MVASLFQGRQAVTVGVAPGPITRHVFSETVEEDKAFVNTCPPEAYGHVCRGDVLESQIHVGAGHQLVSNTYDSFRHSSCDLNKAMTIGWSIKGF